MSLRDELIELVDEVRQDVLVDCTGLRIHAVHTRTTTWDGGRPGSGTPTHTDVEITPRPKVMEPSPRYMAAQPGAYQDGDRIVRKVSARYTEAELTGRPTSPDAEFVWLIDGEVYTVARAWQKSFEWIVHLRKAN